MTDLLLDTITGDLAVVDGDLVLITTEQVLIRQQVEITLKTFRGEWGYNVDFGVPYATNENNSTQILGKVSKSVFDLHIRTAILSVDGVLGLDFYSSEVDFPSQVISITFRASIRSGSVSEIISVNI